MPYTPCSFEVNSISRRLSEQLHETEYWGCTTQALIIADCIKNNINRRTISLVLQKLSTIDDNTPTKTEEQKMLAERRSFYGTYNYFGKQLSKQLREMNNSIESRLYIAEIIAGCLKDNLSDCTLRNVTQKLDAIIQRRDKEQAKKKPTKVFISQPMNGAQIYAWYGSIAAMEINKQEAD